MAQHHIVLYASGECPHCQAARAALEASGQPFEERDPLASRAGLKELMLLSAVASVPTIVVSGHVLVGFDGERLDELLRMPPPEPDPIDDYTPEELIEDDGT
jgi:glutaredoxin